MQKQSNGRRRFLKQAGLLTAAANLSIFATANIKNNPPKGMFIHHVYFWLKNPESKEDLQKLIEGLKKLTKINYIRMFHIGVPADTNRDVIDTSYSISWLNIFDNKEDEEKYQVDPIHLKFVEECSPLWSKVLVYDSVDA